MINADKQTNFIRTTAVVVLSHHIPYVSRMNCMWLNVSISINLDMMCKQKWNTNLSGDSLVRNGPESVRRQTNKIPHQTVEIAKPILCAWAKSFFLQCLNIGCFFKASKITFYSFS